MYKYGKVFMQILIAIVVLFNIATGTPASAQQSCTDGMAFVQDVTIPDGTTYKPGEQFTKTWRIKNTGNCTWSTAYVFRYVEGELMWASPEFINMPAGVGTNNTIDLSVKFTAPQLAGSYTSFWQMKNDKGIAFGSKIWVKINVSAATQPTAVSGAPVVQASSTQEFIQPKPNDFDFRSKDANSIEVYYQGVWLSATKSPENKYEFPQISGTLSLLTYSECSNVWNSQKWWWENVCVTKQRAVQDLGIHPAVTISREGTIEFYSYLNSLTFGMVGSVYGGTLKGINGYKIYEVGNTGSITASTVRTVLSRAAVPVLVVSYIHYSNKVFLVTYPLSPAPVPVPLPYKYTIAAYAGIEGLYNPVIGFSRGDKSGSNWWVGWQFISLNGVCSLYMNLRLPNKTDNGFKLTHEQKHDTECDMGKILTFVFEVVKKAMEAGVTVETCQWFLNTIVPIIAKDFNLDKALIDAILKLLSAI